MSEKRPRRNSNRGVIGMVYFSGALVAVGLILFGLAWSLLQASRQHCKSALDLRDETHEIWLSACELRDELHTLQAELWLAQVNMARRERVVEYRRKRLLEAYIQMLLLEEVGVKIERVCEGVHPAAPARLRISAGESSKLIVSSEHEVAIEQSQPGMFRG